MRIGCPSAVAVVPHCKNRSFIGQQTVLCNLSTALRSYHSVDPKFMQRYLVEFEYRFNRRYSLLDRIQRLAYVTLRTLPMSENS